MLIKKTIMNKFVITAIAILLFQGLKSQETLQNNKLILGGSFNYWVQHNSFPISSLSHNFNIGGFYSSSDEDSKNTVFAFAPLIAKELNRRLMLGIQLEYRTTNFKVDNQVLFGNTNPVDFERSSNQFGIGLFSRHTINPQSQFQFFLQPIIDYYLLNEEELHDSNLTQKEKAHFFEIGLDAGILYNFNNWIGATFRVGGLNYVNGSWKIVDTATKKDFSSFGTNLNLASIYFGLEIKI